MKCPGTVEHFSRTFSLKLLGKFNKKTYLIMLGRNLIEIPNSLSSYYKLKMFMFSRKISRLAIIV